ncbi:MAG: hypothetical protein WCK98_05375 [bacterium]
MANIPLIKAIFKPTTRPTGTLVFAPKTKLNLALIQVKNTIKFPWKSVLVFWGITILIPKFFKKIFRKS